MPALVAQDMPAAVAVVKRTSAAELEERTLVAGLEEHTLVIVIVASTMEVAMKSRVMQRMVALVERRTLAAAASEEVSHKSVVEMAAAIDSPWPWVVPVEIQAVDILLVDSPSAVNSVQSSLALLPPVAAP